MEATFSPYILAFGWIGLCLILGTLLRSKIKIFQTMLLPSAIIGGLLGFIFMNTGIIGAPSSKGWIEILPSSFGVITFHLFVISLLGVSLLKTEGESNNLKKTFWKGAWWICCVFAMIYAMQGLLGLGIFTVFDSLFASGTNPILGYLFGAGFTQGPGQAVSYGTVYEAGGIPNAVNIGLTFAAFGFFACSFIGVPLAKFGIKKGWCTVKEDKEISQEVATGIMDKDNQISTISNITHSSNMESLGYHLAIFFIVYFVAYSFAVAWQTFMPQTIKPLGFGMLFMWAMLLAIITQNSLVKLNLGHWLDNATTRRFTGLFMDFMVVSVFMSIEVQAIQHLFVPIIITVIIGSALTLFVALWFGRRLPELGFERTLYIVGTCTGTSATGLLLVRMVDPEFKTSVASEGAMFNVPFLVIGAPLLAAVPLAYIPELYWTTILTFTGTLIAMPILLLITRQISTPKF